MKCTKYRNILVLKLLIAASPMWAQNQSACNAEIINSFRTYYHSSETSSVAQTIHDVACNSGIKQMGVGVVGIGGFNQAELSQACHNNDLKYFESHAKVLSISFIPPEAMATIQKVCSPENLFLSVTENGSQVNVKAHWEPVEDFDRVRVRSFLHTANLKCKGQSLSLGQPIGKGGAGVICTRSDDKSVAVALQTDRGGYRVATLPGIDRASYKLLIYAADDHMACFVNDTQVGEITMGSRDNPQPAIDLNAHFHSGSNTVTCRPQDIHPNGAFQPCWYYRYKILKDDKELVSNQNECCGRGCPSQPLAPTPLVVVRP